MPGRPAPIVPRFWPKVHKTDGCWLWTAATDQGGRGKFSVNGRLAMAHRVSWELHFGPIPPGRLVCHRCDVPPCVRPDHLFLGSQADNMDDARRKGRWSPRLPDAKQRRGDAHPMAKVTGAQVEEMRERYRGGETGVSIALSFGLSNSQTYRILRGLNWQVAS